MKFLARGKRSEVFLISKNRVIKKKRKDSDALGTIEREFEVLKKLNKVDIGPKVFKWDNGIVMEYVKGERIKDYLAKSSRGEILKVISNVIKQCRKLDTMGLNKEEMVNPYKHIIVGKKVVMIDFERCKQSKKPGNLTQFTSFLMRKDTSKLLAKKGIFAVPWRLQKLAKKYKHNQNIENYTAVYNEIMQKNTTAKIYYACFKVPKGKVTSYKALGNAAGIKGYRAVGQAMNKNPFAPIVPCHRVINVDGKLGGFATGVKNKIKLLESEGIKIKDRKVYINNF